MNQEAPPNVGKGAVIVFGSVDSAVTASPLNKHPNAPTN